MAITMTVNGVKQPVEVTPGTPLLWVLRDHLGLTGTKFGCGVAQCGACTVHVNGRRAGPVSPIEAVANGEIHHHRGRMGRKPTPSATPGRPLTYRSAAIVNQVRLCRRSLLQAKPTPSDDDIDLAMNGNLCRCATYVRIRRAIKTAAKEIKS